MHAYSELKETEISYGNGRRMKKRKVPPVCDARFGDLTEFKNKLGHCTFPIDMLRIQL